MFHIYFILLCFTFGYGASPKSDLPIEKVSNDDYGDYYGTNRDTPLQVSTTCELGYVISYARDELRSYKSVDTLRDVVEAVAKNITRLSKKGTEIHYTSDKHIKKHLKELKSSLKLILTKCKQFKSKSRVIKQLMNFLYKLSRNPVFDGNELFTTLSMSPIDVLTKELAELELFLYSVPLSFMATRQIGQNKMKSLQKKISDIQETVSQLSRAVNKTMEIADKFITRYGTHFNCARRCFPGGPYCNSDECMPGYEGYACHIESYDFGKCVIREGNLTTFDGYEYELKENDMRYLSSFLRHTWMSFYVLDTKDNGVSVSLVSGIYTLHGNGQVKMNNVTQVLPMYKNITAPVSGHVSIERIGQWLILHSSIYQLTVELSTAGSNDVNILLSSYWKTLVAGKCGNFDGIEMNNFDYGY